ncbi:hypothetical protein DJ030_15095 [bacterium endosymbiont of Escarpia laminata]|nr:MAG: hypothetical protein DJ030_15095 [bacterium endosymbiont of Escarpia laminata]
MKANVVFLLLSLTFLNACSDDPDLGSPVDTTAPVIALLGADPLNLSVGDTYADPGVTALDDVDGNITGNIVVAGDTVNMAVEGTYVVTYDVSDAAGNAAIPLTRTVNVEDNTAPDITLLGANPLNLSVGDTYTDPGVTALDNVDGNITGNIVVAGDTVDTAIVGTYVVTYDVSDAAGNAATQVRRTVNVEDNTAPVITLFGANPLNLSVGDTYTSPSVIALDNVDGNITGNIVVAGDVVNTSIVGTYFVTYNVSDAAGNPATQLTHTVNVEDNAAPVITLLGANPLNLSVGDTYTDPGATALDNVDGNITGNIVVAGDVVNTSIVGTYFVTYNVSDAAGNPALQLTRTVNVGDDTAPILTRLGLNPLNLSVGDTYTDPGATALDNVDGDITGNIVVAGDTVNTAVEGTYTVIYNVSDAAGNAAIPLTRTVNVDGTPPVITLLGTDPLNFLVGGTYTDPGATATDDIDGDITGNIVVAGDTVDTAVEGTYLVTYDVSDAAGNPATQLARAVNVDGTPPVITLLGTDPLDLSVGDTYSDPGVTATDDIDGDITGNIVVAGDTVDTAVEGTYLVTYDVSDAAGNPAAQLARTVNVVNDPPVINDLSISPDPAFINSAATFSWDVSDVNGDTLTCTLDVENDGTDDYTINDCENNTSQVHTYTLAGDYTAKLTVDDGIATPVTRTLGFTVIAPLSTDVSVTGPAVADERVLYTITVGNTTLLPIDDVTVSLVVPAELSFHGGVDAEPNVFTNGGCHSGTFCDPTEVAVWTLGTLAAGESRTISVNSLVGAATLNGVTITLPVTFSATAISDVQIDKLVDVFNTPPADLVLSASTDPVVASETFTYQLDFGNTSAGSLTTVELRAFLPSGVTVSTISDGGIEVNPGEVVWNEGSLVVGASLHREITVTADAGLITGQILKTTAQLTHDGSQAVDNTAEHALTVVSGVLPLEIDISTSANPVVANERVLYTLTVSNSSQVQVNDVSVQLRVPAELSFHGGVDAEPNVTTNGGCHSGTFCDPTEEALWALGALAAGESRTITVNALVASVEDGNLITTPVRVTATGLGDDIDLLKTVAVFNDPSADLALGASTDPVVANETFTYQLDFGNTSAGSLTTVELRAFLPSGVTVSTISDGGIEVNLGEVVWNEGSLVVGASLHREITVTADAGLITGQILKTTAQLTHDGSQAVDNTAEHALTVVSGVLPLEIDISTSANPVVANERVLYTLTVSNSSQVQVNDVSVQLRVPAELSFHGGVDAEPNVTTNGGCHSGTFCDPTEEALWALGALAAGESRTITVNALVADVSNGNLITTPVRVTATGLGDDIDLLKTVAVFNDPSADLALGASTDPVVASETFTYQLDFGNTSAGSLTTVELRAFLPSGVTVNSISDGGMEGNPGEVVWNEGSLVVGASLHREITVVADGAEAGDILTLSAELSHDGGLEIDNRSEFSVSVAKSTGIASLLSVNIAATPQPVASSGILAYTITVTNDFGLQVDNVIVIFRVPAELSFHGGVDAEPDVFTNGGCHSGTFCDPTEEALWALGTMAAGSNQVITINATVGAAINDGNLIVVPVRVTTTGMEDTINLQHTTVILN